MDKRKIIFVSLLVISGLGVVRVGGQTDGTTGTGKGNKPPATTKSEPKTKPPQKVTPQRPNNNVRQPARPTTPNTPKTESYCAESTISVSCGLPDCLISVDGKTAGVTGVNGTLEIPASGGRAKKITASKNGYEPSAPKSVNVPCGELVTVAVTLRSKPFNWRLRTSLPNSEIYINDPPVLLGKSDDNGVFEGRSETGMVFVQAKKTGYLTESVTITPETAQKEIAIRLKPMPARISISSTVSNATAQIKGEDKIYDAAETIPVEPGLRQVIVSALGFAPVVFELDLKPNQKVEKAVKLQLLPVNDLLREAESAFGKEAYLDAIRLCQYILQTEPAHPAANRLLGAVYLEKKDYVQAEPYLLKAAAGNEAVVFKIRRHFNEKFELSGGHGAACEGELRLTRGELEFRGFTVTSENFKVPLAQVQLVGLEMKKNTALFLGLKVTDAKGNRKEYNFFSRDQELTQADKFYLSLILKLLQQRKNAG